MNDQLNSEEREILEKFKRGELRPASNVEHEIKQARQAARSTFKKTRRVDLRVNCRMPVVPGGESNPYNRSSRRN